MSSDDLMAQNEIAADFLEGLLDIADLDGDIDMEIENERPLVSIVGADLSQLVGPDGKVLDALQELTRLAVLRETGERSRVMVDISGHRAAKKAAIAEIAQTAIEKVKSTGEPLEMDPMNAFERKIVHDTVAAAGLASDSAGEEPKRYVVISPA